VCSISTLAQKEFTQEMQFEQEEIALLNKIIDFHSEKQLE